MKRGVNFRILTMNPNSSLVNIREKEDVVDGHIKKSITDLVEWADKYNEQNFKGKIIIKGYNCMTLDFYWRVDDEVFIGPYWYRQPSNQTITYAFSSKGEGFNQYTAYFERLWDDKTNVIPLTKIVKTTGNRRKTRR